MPLTARRGVLICVSGVDGSGKSTQIRLLAEWLERRSVTVVSFWSRVGYTPGFLAVKGLMRRMLGSKVPSPGISPQREAILSNPWMRGCWVGIALVDLALTYAVRLRVALLKGHVVVCDRYLEDSAIDLRMAFGLRPERLMVWKIVSAVCPRPDIQLFLTIPAIESERRSLEKGDPFPESFPDRQKRISYYQEAMSVGIQRLDGRQPEAELAGHIQALVEAYMRGGTVTAANDRRGVEV